MTNETDETRYTLVVSEKQLQAISHACEVVARLGLGQLDMALEFCRNEDGNRALTWDDIQEIEQIVKPKLGLEMNSSYGVGKFKDVDRLFDIRDTIRYKLSWDSAIKNGKAKYEGDRSDFLNTMGVSFDKPMNWSEELLPIVEKLESEHPYQNIYNLLNMIAIDCKLTIKPIEKIVWPEGYEWENLNNDAKKLKDYAEARAFTIGDTDSAMIIVEKYGLQELFKILDWSYYSNVTPLRDTFFEN